VARPWKTGRASVAALMRRIDAESPTLLLDESDTAFQGRGEFAGALQGLLNEGYRRRGFHTICTPQGANGWQTQTFRVFSAKAIAGIGFLPGTVVSRSIPIRLKRKLPHEVIEDKFEEELWAQADPLSTRLQAWAAEAIPRLRGARPQTPAELQNRTAEVCRPLLAIAELAGPVWATRAQRALVLLLGSAGEGEPPELDLLAAVRRVYRTRSDEAILTSDLLRALAADEELPYQDWWDQQAGAPRSGAARRLANKLRPFGIRPVDLRTANGVQKGYRWEAFAEPWQRYLTDESELAPPTVEQPLAPDDRPESNSGPMPTPPHMAASGDDFLATEPKGR
jgi:hypothetical protein